MADVTVVGQGIFLRGSIRGEGDLEIRGRIEGDVEVAGEVTIAEGALVKADVTARRITVRGAVAGNLTGEDGVRLEDGARVVGDLRGASIGISEGALVRGNVQTGQAGEAQKAAARKPLPLAKPSRPRAPKRARLPRWSQGNGAPRRAPAAAEERPGPPPPGRPRAEEGCPRRSAQARAMSDSRDAPRRAPPRALVRAKEGVILASGRESDFFIDCKQTILTAEGHALVGELMFDALDELPACEAVAGVELGGCPLASAVSLVSFQKGRPLPRSTCAKSRRTTAPSASSRAIAPSPPGCPWWCSKTSSPPAARR